MNFLKHVTQNNSQKILLNKFSSHLNHHLK